MPKTARSFRQNKSSQQQANQENQEKKTKENERMKVEKGKERERKRMEELGMEWYSERWEKNEKETEKKRKEEWDRMRKEEERKERDRESKRKEEVVMEKIREGDREMKEEEDRENHSEVFSSPILKEKEKHKNVKEEKRMEKELKKEAKKQEKKERERERERKEEEKRVNHSEVVETDLNSPPHEQFGKNHKYAYARRKGTSVMAFTMKGGVIVACDHTLASEPVPFPENIINLNKYVLVAVAGAYTGKTPDFRSFLKDLKRKFHIYETAMGRSCYVTEASTWVANNTLSACSNEDLPIDFTILGWDKPTNRPGLYSVGSSSDGDLFESRFVSSGSGDETATYEAMFSRLYPFDMSFRDATEFARKAIRKAATGLLFDIELRYVYPGELGGVISGYHVGPCAWELIFSNEKVGESSGMLKMDQMELKAERKGKAKRNTKAKGKGKL